MLIESKLCQGSDFTCIHLVIKLLTPAQWGLAAQILEQRADRHPSPLNCLQVVGALLDAEAADEFVNNLILSVRSLIPVEQLCAEVEKRNRWTNKVAGCCA